MIANGMTRTPTATPNGNQGGACALAGCVKIVTAANVALSAGGCAARGVYVLKVRLVATFDGAERVPAEGEGGVA